MVNLDVSYLELFEKNIVFPYTDKERIGISVGTRLSLLKSCPNILSFVLKELGVSKMLNLLTLSNC